MTKKETYDYSAERTGYKPTQIRAVFTGRTVMTQLVIANERLK